MPHQVGRRIEAQAPVAARRAALAAALAAAAGGCATPRFIPRLIPYPPPPATPAAYYLGRLHELPIARTTAAPPASRDEGARPGAAVAPTVRAFADLRPRRPSGLAVAADVLWVADPAASCVHRLDFASAQHRQLTGSPPYDFSRPIDVASGDRAVFVADAGGRVFTCDPAGTPRAILDLHDQPFTPVSLAAARGDLFVLNRATRSLERFSFDDGEPRLHSRRPAPFAACVAADSSGRLLVADPVRARVAAPDADTAFAAAPLLRPTALDFDAAGRLFVADAGLQCVLVFDAAGALVSRFGAADSDAAPLVLPSGLAVSRLHLAYYEWVLPADFRPEAIVFVADRVAGIGVFAWRTPE